MQRVQKVQRVKVGGYAASIDKTFITGLRPWENHTTGTKANPVTLIL